ncbi:MAG: WbqC family protein [Bacteroidales bacterium]|nr:WbqC family protein [Bacteroidales bacterium]
MLLSVAYLPPVGYISHIAREIESQGQFFIEACENFQKQSWRNRCRILSASGPEDLLVPIIHRDGTHDGIPITEIEIDYSTNWPLRHERAIVSAYRSAAYFDYYADSFLEILRSRPATLWELDIRYTGWLLEKFSIRKGPVPLTEDFTAPGTTTEEESCYGRDLRYLIHPKKPELTQAREYFQVFGSRFGFTPGLSSIDLLFNEGPESISTLL